MSYSNKTIIHKRFKNFVNWIAPDSSTVEKIKSQADEIRSRIKRRAEEAGYRISGIPFSGSYAKKTGLRRHLPGNSEVEGQDIDMGFLIHKTDKEGNAVEDCLIWEFVEFAEDAYPQTTVGNTKSSATLDFSGSKLKYDLVPLILTDDSDIQILIRTNGEERSSSVKKHAEFIKSRNRESNSLAGVVRFNQCLRLVKWWRYHMQSDSRNFGNGENDDHVPSILLDLLCAKAYDECSVQNTYSETLRDWFSFLLNVVKNRKPVLFKDNEKRPKNDPSADWTIADPVNSENNIVKNWKRYEIDELAEWFALAKAGMARAIRHDEEGNDVASLNELIKLFGNSFKHYCD